MMRKNNSNGGYMMLLLFIIGVVVIIAFIVRTDLFGGDRNVIENGKNAFEDAKKATNNVENGYRFDPEAEERSLDNSN
jgi:hypothetical protein